MRLEESQKVATKRMLFVSSLESLYFTTTEECTTERSIADSIARLIRYGDHSQRHRNQRRRDWNWLTIVSLEITAAVRPHRPSNRDQQPRRRLRYGCAVQANRRSEERRVGKEW